MKVLLINPQAPNLYTMIGSKFPPLGIAYLAAVLEQSGHTPEIFDMDVSRKKVNFSDFDAIGISCLTPKFPAGLEIAKKIKKENPDLPVIMGGYHPTFCDFEVLESGWIDFVVRGEGEEILPNLLNHLDHPENVSGISYVSSEKIIRNPSPLPPQDLDALPFPARDLLELLKYPSRLDEYPMTTMMTSRGCPFNCEFCASSKFAGKKWRARSPKSVVDEMEFLSCEFGYKAVYFVDDNFVLSPSRAMAISEEIIRRKLKMKWMAFSRVETIVKHPSMVKIMAKAGLTIAFLGIESVDPKIHSKKISHDDCVSAVKTLSNFGVKTWASFMIGAIKETEIKISHSFRFAKKLNPHIVQFSIVTPYPGTYLWEKVKTRLTKPIRWELFDCTHSVFKTDFLSSLKLQKLLANAYIKFYIRPQGLRKEFKDALTKRHLFRSLVIYPLRGMRGLKLINKT